MHEIRSAALASVAKGCAFAFLAIFMFTAGLSWNPLLAARTAATLVTMMTMVLLLKAMRAPVRPYKHTEVWLILDETQRPPAATAQWVCGSALREAYLTFALWGAALSAGLWATALVLSAVL